jgi:PAS domain S-box-containing protein
MIKLLVTVAVVIMAAVDSRAQKSDFRNEALFVKSYSGKDFRCSLFFYDISEDSNGCILLTTSSGLYVMDGGSFKRYKTSRLSGLSKAFSDKKNNIFVCGDADFGFFRNREDGSDEYVPLSENFNFESESISDIYVGDSEVYFCGNKSVYCYDYQNFLKVSEFSVFRNICCMNMPCCADTAGGVYFLGGKKARYRFSLKELGLSIYGTRISYTGSDGDIFITDGCSFYALPFEKFTSNDSLQLSDFKIIKPDYKFPQSIRYLYLAYDKKTKRTAVAFNHKAAVFDGDFRHITDVDSAAGLPVERIYYMYFDSCSRLWLSSVYHVTKAEISAPVILYGKKHGIDGTVFASRIIGGRLYCCGVNGLKVSEYGDSLVFKGIEFDIPTEPNFVSWDVSLVGDKTVAVSTHGLFEISGLKAKRILKMDNIYRCCTSKKYPGKIFLAAYSGLYVADYETVSGLLKIKNCRSVEPVGFPLWDIDTDDGGNIWVASIFSGLYRLFPEDDSFTKCRTVCIGENMEIFKSVRQMGFSATGGVLRIYDYGFYEAKLPEKEDFTEGDLKFEFDTVINNYCGKIEEGGPQYIRIKGADDVLIRDFDKYIIANEASNGWNFDTLAIKHKTYTIFSAQKCDSLLLLSTEIGLLVYNMNARRSSFPEKQPFNVLITSVKLNNKDVFSGYKYFEPGSPHIYSPSDGSFADFGDKVYGVEFAFSSTCFEYAEKNSYSYFLEGHSRRWTDYSEINSRNFGQLPPGEYTFMVKAKNYIGIESGTAVYKFRINLPWYRRWWAVTVYAFFIAAAVLLYIKQRTKALKKMNLNLEKRAGEMNAELSVQNRRLKIMSLAASKTTNSVIILDPDGRFVYVNHSFKKVYGYTLEEFKRKYSDNYFDAVLGNDVESNYYITLARDLCQSQSFEYYHFDSQNRKIYTQMTVDPIFDEKNDLCNWMIGETDITSLKKSAEETLEQTKALTTAYMELSTQNAEIERQRQQLIEANDKLEEGYEKIARQNLTITESMRYARSIQNSILPSDAAIGEYLDFFTIYMPKDIVSGDFYIYEKLSDGEFIMIVADCTGHGVPGAFMSLIGYDILEQIIRISGITEPVEILERLSADFTKTLKQDSEHNTDGIDLSICRFVKSADGYDVTFSGTRSSLYFFSGEGNKISKIRGSQRQIGYGFESVMAYEFESHRFKFTDRDFIIMLSDGLTDQCDKKRRRFGSQRFSEFLVLNADSSMRDMGKHLGVVLNDFMSATDQRDDITVLGLRIKK